MSLRQSNDAELKGELYFYYFLFLAAAITFAFGVYVAQRSIVLSQHGVVAQGEVIAIERRLNSSTNSNSQDSFHPVIEFLDTQNNRHSFESDVSIEPNELLVGEKLEVLFDPEDPDNAVINSWQGLWLWPVLCIVISFSLVLTGLAAIRGVRKKQNNELSST